MVLRAASRFLASGPERRAAESRKVLVDMVGAPRHIALGSPGHSRVPHCLGQSQGETLMAAIVCCTKLIH